MNNSASAPALAQQLELSLAAGHGTNPVLTTADRLSFTFCLALLFHAVVILGVVFAPQDQIGPRYEFMEIMLVQQSSEPPEDAEDFPTIADGVRGMAFVQTVVESSRRGGWVEFGTAPEEATP